jgi:multidrug efflux pump subunit AcrA (membrane-fusion protein)
VTAKNTVHVNNVTLGPQYGNKWVVKSGLNGGSLVITDNVQKLREGATVAPEMSGSRDAVSHSAQPGGR